MSLFKEQEVTAEVYKSSYSGSTKTANMVKQSFTIEINILRRNEEDEIVFGETLGSYYATVDSNLLDRGYSIKPTEGQYKDKYFTITSEPKYLKLFNKYRITLKPLNL